MKLVFLIAVLSLIGVGAAATLPAYADLMLIAGPFAIASVVLLVVLLLRGGRQQEREPIILDGSNVMYWRNDTPELETVLEVINEVRRLGYRPAVMFDANAGYLLSDRYRHDGYFAAKLGLQYSEVMVVPKGTPADPMILQAAKDQKTLIVTNDQFRDWVDDFPEIRIPGFLNKGGYRNGKLWLELKVSDTLEATD